MTPLAPNPSPRPASLVAAAAIAVLGALAALGFCFVVYPRLEGAQHAVLDPDGYGQLGINVWQGYGLTFDPAVGPTVHRGPLYPAFVALALLLAGGRYPESVWVAQSAVHGLTCALVYLFAARVWGRGVARLAGVGCALYLVLFWYVPRMWNEVLLGSLVAATAYVSAVVLERGGRVASTALGVLSGLLALVKATFLPLAVVLPVCLWLWAPAVRRSVWWIPLAAVVVVAPWTVRNYALTGAVVPVHGGAGRELLFGNVYARHFGEFPLTYAALWDTYINAAAARVGKADGPDPVAFLARDRAYRTLALDEMRAEPSLIVRKALVAGAMFWYIGETRAKTLVNLALRLPVLLLAAIGMVAAVRQRRVAAWPAMAIVAVYWLAHLPFAGPARLSVPVMPLMVVFAAAVWPVIVRRFGPSA